jgi:hypothetical protein
MGLCIVMLKHEVMAVDEWHDNGPRDLIMVYLCAFKLPSIKAMPVVIEGEHLPTEVGYLSKLQSGQESGEEHVDELP